MRKTLIAGVCIVVTSMAMTGCTINVGEKDSNWNNNSNWEDKQIVNRNNLNKLTLGMPKEQVMLQMGSADFNEAFVKDEREIQVLFYRTQWSKGDGKTTKDECTPVVLINGSLIGWGESAYKAL